MTITKKKLFLLLSIFFGAPCRIWSASNEGKIYTLRFTGKKVRTKNLCTGYSLLNSCVIDESQEHCMLIAYLHMLCLKKHGTGTFTPIKTFNKNHEKNMEMYDKKVKELDFHPNQSSEVCQIIESIVGGNLENFPPKAFHSPTE